MLLQAAAAPRIACVCAAMSVLLASRPSHGQPTLCTPGINPSGHPLFGTPTVRIDRESVGSANYVARAAHAAFGDLNGDGLADVAATMSKQNAGLTPAYLTVCMNLGNGVFSDPVLYTAGAGCCAVDIGDVDRDGWRDLAVANASANTVSILRNNRDGTFAPPIDIPVGSEPRSLKFADFNRDQIPDLAVLNCATSDLFILRGRPGGGFEPEVRIALIGVTQIGGASPFPGPQLAVGDLNGDGAPDIAAPSSPPWMQGISILLNDGSGGFILPPTVVHAPAYSIEIGDLDGDTKPDLAAINGMKLRTLRGRGDGTFDPPVEYGALAEGSLGSATTHLSLGDIDGDGALDVAIGSRDFVGSTVIFRNRGDGTFQKEEIRSDSQPWFVRLLDLGGRGHHGCP